MRTHRLTGLLVLAACTDVTTPAPVVAPPAYRLSAADVWSGAAVQVVARAPLPGTLPTVILGHTAALVTRIDDTTMGLSAPVGAGIVPVLVVDLGGADSIGALTVHAFDQLGTLYGLWGVLSQLPAAPARVVGNGITGLTGVDLVTGTVMPYPDSMHSSDCDWGPGVTREPGRFVLETMARGSCVGASWQIAPFLERFAATPAFAPVGGPAHGVIAELAPGRWLVGERDDFTLWACAAVCVNTSEDTPADVPGQLDGVRVASLGDRAAVDGRSVGGGGMPVIDAATAMVAYRVPSLAWSEGAAFSAGGDTLFVAGGDSVTGGRCWMFALQASDGVVLDSVPLAVRPGDLALDPGGRWIYVAGQYASYHVSYWVVASGLEVLDRRTLRPVSVMQSDSLPLALSGAVSSKQRLVLDAADHRGYVLRTDLYAVPDSLHWPWTATAVLFGFSTPF